MIAFCVDRAAKGLEGALAHLAAVDGRAGEAKEEGVGQRGAHVDAEVAFLRAVRLIHQHDDVAARQETLFDAVKLVDGGDNDAARVAGEQLRKMVAALGVDGGQAKRFQVLEHLRFQFQPVHDNEDGRVVECGLAAQQVGGDNHGQRLARALRVPFQAGIGCGEVGRAGHDAFNNFLHRAHLVRAQQVLLRGIVDAVEERVVAQQAQVGVAVEEGVDQALQPVVAAVRLPLVERLDAGVPGRAVLQPAGRYGKGNGVADEVGNPGRVGRLNLVKPFLAGVFELGRLVLDERDGQAVDEEHHVQPSPVAVLHPHLFGEVELVGGQVVVVDEGDVELALLRRVVGGPLVAQRVEKALVAFQRGGQQAQRAQQRVDTRVATRPAVERGKLATQHLDQEGLSLVVGAPGRQVVARDEAPLQPLQVVDDAVLNVALFGDARHCMSLNKPGFPKKPGLFSPGNLVCVRYPSLTRGIDTH